MVLRRCLAALPLLLVLSLVSFTLIHALPGDPVEAMMGKAVRDIDPRQLESLRREFGLDQPLYKQYLIWLGGWVGHGELGRSYQDGRKVLEVIAERVPATVALLGTSLLLSFGMGIVWGAVMVLTRMNERSRLRPLEVPLVGMALISYSVPSFVIGIMVVFAISVVPSLEWVPLFGTLPPGGGSLVELLPCALVPALVLSFGRAAKVALFIRSLALDEIGKNYVTLALAKGLNRRQVLLRHVTRNCLLPVINLMALSLPALFGGSVLIETVFAWPGTGRLAVDATFGRNYPVMTTLVMLYGTMVVASNLLADLLQIIVDPRLKESELANGNQK